MDKFWILERFMFGRWDSVFGRIKTESEALELFNKAKETGLRPHRLVRVERYIVEDFKPADRAGAGGGES